MDREVPTVTPDDDARAAIDLLAKSDLGAIPVVDSGNKVVGIVSESDLILSEEESDLHLPHYLNIMGGIVFVRPRRRRLRSGSRKRSRPKSPS